MKTKLLHVMVPIAFVSALILFSFGGAWATSFSDVLNWNPFTGWIWTDEPFTYVHDIPEGTINSAALSIYGEMVDDGSIVHLTGAWNPQSHTWAWNRSDLNILNFWNHKVLDVTVFAEGLPSNDYDFAFHMLSSELTGDYNPASTGEIPEPNTLLLLGVGLVGMAGYGRYRLKKKG